MMDARIRDAAKLITGMATRHSVYDAFRDTVEAGFHAFAKISAPPTARDAHEDAYMRTIGRWPKDVVRQTMPAVHGLAMRALNEGGVDFWGCLAGELGSLNTHLGQFFTPYDLCRLSAAITLGDSPFEGRTRRYITVAEPACGSGAMLLAAADHLCGLGYNPADALWVDATDVSPLAYHMCYLTLTCAGVPGVVRLGNSLTLEVTEERLTHQGILFVQKHGWPGRFPRRRKRRGTA